MKKGRGKSVAALLAALMAAAPVCGERFNARLPMKVYLRSREGLPDRLLGFTPATPQHPVTRPREGIWYVQPTGPLTNAHAKSLGAILRTRGVPGVDFSDHWDLTDDRFERIGRQPQLRYLNVSRTPLTDRAMRLVGKWTALNVLALGENITDAGFASLEGLTHLVDLSLDRTRVSDRSLLIIISLHQLQKLDLSGTSISDHGLLLLSQLQRLKELVLGGSITDGAAHSLSTLRSLRSIDISETQLSGDGLAAIASLPNLRSLSVNRSLNDAGLKKIAGSQSLKSLDLSGAAITDGGLKTLGGMKNLEELALTDTAVGDSGIEALAKLPKLRILEVSNTRVTSAGLRRLAKIPSLTTVSLSRDSLSRDDVLNLSKLSHVHTILVNGVPLPPAVMAQLRDLASAPPARPAEERKSILGKAGKAPPPTAEIGLSMPASHPEAIIDQPAAGAPPAISPAKSKVMVGTPPAPAAATRGWHPFSTPAAPEALPLSPRLAAPAGVGSPSNNVLQISKLQSKTRRPEIGSANAAGSGDITPSNVLPGAALGPNASRKEDDILKAIQLHTKQAGRVAVPSLNGLHSLQSGPHNALSDLVSGEKDQIHMQEDRPENKIADIEIGARH